MMQKKCLQKDRKLYTHKHEDVKKAFDKSSKKLVKCLLRIKGIPEVIVTAVNSLYERTTTKVRVDSDLLDKLSVKVGVHQDSVYYIVNKILTTFVNNQGWMW